MTLTPLSSLESARKIFDELAITRKWDVFGLRRPKRL